MPVNLRWYEKIVVRAKMDKVALWVVNNLLFHKYLKKHRTKFIQAIIALWTWAYATGHLVAFGVEEKQYMSVLGILTAAGLGTAANH